MTDDRVVSRDGQRVTIREDELERLLETAYKQATWQAIRSLGVEDSAEIAEMSCDAAFGQDHLTAHVTLKDGRTASATAPLWPGTHQAN